MTAKVLTGAQRASRAYRKKTDSGLQQIKLWVHPNDVAAVRNYAAKKPDTKAARAG